MKQLIKINYFITKGVLLTNFIFFRELLTNFITPQTTCQHKMKSFHFWTFKITNITKLTSWSSKLEGQVAEY